MGQALLRVAVIPSLLAFGACHGSTVSSDAELRSLAGREYLLKVPASHDSAPLPPRPLVLVMHGYGADATDVEQWFQLDPLADELGFFVAYPRGTRDPSGRRFFNATDACCDFYGSDVDDVAFLDQLISHLEAEYAIDPARVYAVGHSNGGFMAFRLACDLSSRIAAIVSLEGATWSDPSRCRPSSPVGVLEVHGSADTTISPQGGSGVDGYAGYVYPSVASTMLDWARLDGCASKATGPSPGAIDSETSGPVAAERWEGCAAGMEQWMIGGGTHTPALTELWPRAVVSFLIAEAKQETPARSENDTAAHDATEERPDEPERKAHGDAGISRAVAREPALPPAPP